MKIKLSPVCVTETTNAPAIVLNGLTLSVGNTSIDLSQVPEGGQAEASEESPLVGIVTRDEVTVKYPYSTDIYEPMQSTNPLDYEFEITTGAIKCPLIKKKAASDV